MSERAILVLEDGSAFRGYAFGAAVDAEGEVVFNTGMTGYQEISTDPSYRGQMVVLTYPLIGNYGITLQDEESVRPWIAALIVRDYYADFSNWRAEDELDGYLARAGVPGLHGIDTRALTRRLRTRGTMRAVLTRYHGEPDVSALTARAQRATPLSEKDLVGETSVHEAYRFEKPSALFGSRGDLTPSPFPAREGEQDGGRYETSASSPIAVREGEQDEGRDAASSPSPLARVERERGLGGEVRPRRIVVVDCGIKHNILRSLRRRGVEVVVVPHFASAAEILALDPAGVVIANGPGDPATLPSEVETARELIASGRPLLGICLGHQIIGQAIGGTTSRLHFGHHGGNHPVKDLTTGLVHITSQNHEFQLDAASIPASSGFFVSQINLNDGSVEGLAHPTLPVLSVQYHPEGSPGPQDNQYLFDRFLALVDSVNPAGSVATLRNGQEGSQVDGS